jgi:hypothetical protein
MSAAKNFLFNMSRGGRELLVPWRNVSFLSLQVKVEEEAAEAQ